MAIIISKPGEFARVVEKTTDFKEDYLQAYVSNNPESLPVRDIKESARLLVVSREFSTDSGPIDVLAIDGDGDIYIIETKLYKNPDKRLVVAQVLDYGAALWHAYPDGKSFVAEIDRALLQERKKGLDSCLSEFYSQPGETVSQTREAIGANLTQGNIHFIVLMDRLHDRLKALIQFLNDRSGFYLYAVEMEFYSHNGIEVVIPKLFGAETVKSIDAGAIARRKWDWESFRADAAAKVDATAIAAIEKLRGFAEREGAKITFGTSKRVGRLIVAFPELINHSLYFLQSDGWLVVLSGSWSDETPKDKAVREELVRSLVSMGFDLSRHQLVWDSTSDIPSDEWVPRVDELIEVFASTLKRHR